MLSRCPLHSLSLSLSLSLVAGQWDIVIAVMVLDLCNDAELSYQIWKYCGLTEPLTRFYVSEIVSALELSRRTLFLCPNGFSTENVSSSTAPIPMHNAQVHALSGYLSPRYQTGKCAASSRWTYPIN